MRKKPLSHPTFDEAAIRRISPERNLSNARIKYMKLSEEELVNKVIEVEQYVAVKQKRWVASHFEKFT